MGVGVSYYNAGVLIILIYFSVLRTVGISLIMVAAALKTHYFFPNGLSILIDKDQSMRLIISGNSGGGGGGGGRIFLEALVPADLCQLPAPLAARKGGGAARKGGGASRKGGAASRKAEGAAGGGGTAAFCCCCC